MLKKKIFYTSICMIAASMLSLSASAKSHTKQVNHKHFQKDQFYVGGILGYAEPTDFKVTDTRFTKDHGSGVFGLSFGMNVNDYFRTGLEITHRNKRDLENNIPEGGSTITHKTSLKSTSAMLNAYFMLPNKEVKPYFVLGAGPSYNSFGDITTKDNIGTTTPYKKNSKTSFAYQAGAGISFDHKKWSYDGELKYINRGTAETKASTSNNRTKAHLKDLVFSLGVRYNFAG